MKILHVIAGIDIRAGGPTYALLNILKAEQSIGFENEVLTIRTAEMEEQVLNQSVCHVVDCSFPARFSRSKYANRWLRLNLGKFDVVHIHGIWSFLSLESGFICLRNRVRYVFRGHGSLDPFDLRKKTWIKKLIGLTIYRFLFQRAAAFFCTASGEAENLETYGATSNRIVVPLSVDYLNQGGSRKRFRSRYSFADDEFVLLFLSRIDYKKGLDKLIPALALISQDFENVKLVIAGGDSHGYSAKVHHWVKLHNLEDRVIFSGNLVGDEKADAFAGADLFALPSQNENFGVAVVEALQSGLPVMISDNVYIHESVELMNGGWICQYSVPSVQSTLYKILSDPEEYERKRQDANAAGEIYSSARLGDTYRMFYNQVMKTPMK